MRGTVEVHRIVGDAQSDSIYNSFCSSCALRSRHVFFLRTTLDISMIVLHRIFLFAYSCGCLAIKSILHGFFLTGWRIVVDPLCDPYYKSNPFECRSK